MIGTLLGEDPLWIYLSLSIALPISFASGLSLCRISKDNSYSFSMTILKLSFQVKLVPDELIVDVIQKRRPSDIRTQGAYKKKRKKKNIKK